MSSPHLRRQGIVSFSIPAFILKQQSISDATTTSGSLTLSGVTNGALLTFVANFVANSALDALTINTPTSNSGITGTWSQAASAPTGGGQSTLATIWYATAGLDATSLTAPLTAGTAVTNLAVNAIPAPMNSGDTITVGSGPTQDTFTLSAGAILDATALSVNSHAPTYNHSVADVVTDTTVTINYATAGGGASLNRAKISFAEWNTPDTPVLDQTNTQNPAAQNTASPSCPVTPTGNGALVIMVCSVLGQNDKVTGPNASGWTALAPQDPYNSTNHSGMSAYTTGFAGASSDNTFTCQVTSNWHVVTAAFKS